jgi:ABC-type multidrug transport system ATPase subunit
MSDPKLFLFDEPFDGLDVQRTTELMNIVREEKAHRTFLISSHRMDVMERVADAILVLKNGEVASSGGITHVCKDLYSGALPTDGYNLTDAMTHHLQKMAV